MVKKILRVMGTDVEELKNVIGEVVDNKFREQKDRKKKDEHFNKIFKKVVDIPVIEKPIVNIPEKHEHSCPSCKSSFKKLDDGFEICKDCGTTDIKIKKGQKLAACNACGGIIPESFIGISDKTCPHCGSTTGAHWVK